MQKTLEYPFIVNKNAIALYEQKLKNYFNAKYCVAVSSGTAAVIVALKAIEISTKSDVIIPPTAPLCTAFPVLSTGSRLIFADIQEDNLGFDIDSLSKIISSRTGAIIEVPMWGYPTKVDNLQNFAKANKIPLIFDLAQCSGSKFHGKSLSEYCNIACFSTQKNKMFSTGEGGFILTDDEEYYKKSLIYSRIGELNGKDFGLNFKLSPILAEIGINAFHHLDDSLLLRKNNRDKIITGLTHTNIVELEIPQHSCPNYHRLILRTKNGNTKLASHLAAYGIPTDMEKYNIKPLYNYDILTSYKVYCPNAEKFLETAITIEVHQEYSKSDIQFIIDVLNKFPYN